MHLQNSECDSDSEDSVINMPPGLGERSNRRQDKPLIPKIAHPKKFTIEESSLTNTQLSSPTKTAPTGELSWRINSDAKLLFESGGRRGKPIIPEIAHPNTQLSRRTKTAPTGKLSWRTQSDTKLLIESGDDSEQQSKQFLGTLNNLLEDWICSENIKMLQEIYELCQTSYQTNKIKFVQKIVNVVLDKSDKYRELISKLLSKVMSRHLCISQFNKGLYEIIEIASKLKTDTSHACDCIAQILVYPMLECTWTLKSMSNLVQIFPEENGSQGFAGKIIAKLMQKVVKLKGIEWIKNQWIAGGFNWNELTDNVDQVNS